jgi:LacI family transcriptional regulator
MTERSTIYEVARRSGVSTATVSRVMGNGTGFSSATRDRVLSAAADLGWVPSASARGLANRRTGIVGILFPDLASAGDAEEESPLYVDQVIRGAEQAATEAGDAVLIAATRGSSGRERALAVAARVDALVIVARSLPESDIAEMARRLPVVVLSARSGRRAKIDSVSVANRQGIRALVEHLVSIHGYHDLTFMGGPRLSPDSMERFAAFRDALRAAGLAASARPDAEGGFTEAGAARATRALLADRRPPQAIVCGNDEMAVGTLGTLASMGLRVPVDIAVTGFDDLAVTRHVRPHLTTVHQPMREIGATAVRMALARVADPSAPRQAVVLPTELVVRRSCGCRQRTHTPSVAGNGRSI